MPYNCEQLAYHILEFMLAKVIDARIREEERQNSIMKGLWKVMDFMMNAGSFGLWGKLKDLFGGIPIERMQRVLKQLDNRHLIKRSSEGIQLIKKCAFKS